MSEEQIKFCRRLADRDPLNTYSLDTENKRIKKQKQKAIKLGDQPSVYEASNKKTLKDL